MLHSHRTPVIPENPNDVSEEELEALQQQMDEDYEIAVAFRESVVPRAVEWFTGGCGVSCNAMVSTVITCCTLILGCRLVLESISEAALITTSAQGEVRCCVSLSPFDSSMLQAASRRLYSPACMNAGCTYHIACTIAVAQ